MNHVEFCRITVSRDFAKTH